MLGTGGTGAPHTKLGESQGVVIETDLSRPGEDGSEEKVPMGTIKEETLQSHNHPDCLPFLTSVPQNFWGQRSQALTLEEGQLLEAKYHVDPGCLH